LPISLGSLAPEHATLGGFAMTALAGIAALLGGFYEADNDSSGEEEHAPALAEGKAGQPKRIEAAQNQAEDEDELESEPDKKRTKK
jgi:hypothetical protein